MILLKSNAQSSGRVSHMLCSGQWNSPTSLSQSVWAALTKIPWVRWLNFFFLFSQFQRLEIWRSRCLQNQCLWRNLFSLLSHWVFTWQREREEKSSLQSVLIRVQIPFMRAPPSRPNYFLKAPPSTIITLGDRASVYRCWWVGHRYLIHNTSYTYYTQNQYSQDHFIDSAFNL